MNHFLIKPLTWYCPNCGEMLSAYPNADNIAKATCKKCRTEMVMKIISRRRSTLEIFAPKC